MDLVLHHSEERADLLARRETLSYLRVNLADRESEAADLRAQLKAFEGRYLRQVGILYAELDDLEARIAEREVALYQSDDARQRATDARKQAEETHRAAFGEAHKSPEFDPPATLKSLFREVARRIHPDFARTPDEQAHRTRLMARANQAYTRGDTDTLQRILDDHHETLASEGEDAQAELIRLGRQIAHAQRDIAALDAELVMLPTSEIAHLKREADTAKQEGRDLLTELATGLRTQIAEAQYRYNFVERQLFAHGR